MSESTAREVDYLIVGQGLAGTALAWTAIRAGKRVLVVDRQEPVTSSKVAAGILNPITGDKLNLGWKVEELWPVAKSFYRNWEQEQGALVFHETPILRLFTSAHQAALWETKKEAMWDYWRLPEEQRSYRAENGGFETLNAGWLDTRRYLDLSWRALEMRGQACQGELDFEELTLERGSVTWNGVRAKHVVWCQGHESRLAPPFDWVSIRPGKGEILHLRVPDLNESRIINRKKWLLPAEKTGVFRSGSTFDWEHADTKPTEAGRAEIEEGLRVYLKRDFEVTGQEAAVRPMANQGRPLLGVHPEMPQCVYFNGLGAKGALLAPYYAAQLLDHLESGAPIDQEVDICRFWK